MSRIPCPEACRHCQRQREKDEGTIEKLRHVRDKPSRKSRGRTGLQRTDGVNTDENTNRWLERIQKWQDEDKTLQKLTTLVERPKWEEISEENEEVKYYWARWPQLKRRDGKWWYHWVNPGIHEPEKSVTEKLIIPQPGVAEILYEHHDSKMAGHFGREKTLKKLKKSPYFSPKMRETVEKWCKSCDVCMKTKSQRKNARAPMVECHSGVTMERVAVDILGPLTETENGNKFIIVVADYWTKWTEAYPVRDHTAPTVAKVLVDQFFQNLVYH